MKFKDRNDAGHQLADALNQVDYVIAIPRGGVGIAAPIATKHRTPIGLTYPRKLRAPHQAEFAIGAVSETGDIFLNESICKQLKISQTYIDMEVNFQTSDIMKRKQAYPCPDSDLTDKHVVIVDDGIATGFTMLAAVKSLLKQPTKSLTVAVPVSARDSYALIQQYTPIIALHVPQHFGAVGAFYEQFYQMETSEVVNILDKVNKK